MTADDAARDRDESTVAVSDGLHYEWDESRRPSTAIIEAVADATDRDPIDMSPLYDHVDAGALDTLVTFPSDGTTDPITVTFSWDDVKIRLDSAGDIEIQPPVSDGE